VDRTQALRVIGEHAADQWGLITTRQASELGVDRTTLVRLVDAGLLESPTRGVYLIVAASGAAHIRERAAWLRLSPARPAWERQALDEDGGVLSHRSAAELHGLGDLLASQVEFTVPRRRASRDSEIRFHLDQLDSGDVTTVDGLPVTTAERTIIDLLAARVDGGHVGDVLADALRRNLVQLDTLTPRVGGYAARYGVRGQDGKQLLASLLEQVGYTEPQAEHERQVRDVAALIGGMDRSQLAALRESALATQRVTAPMAEAIARQQRVLTPLLRRMQAFQQANDKLRAAFTPMNKSLAIFDSPALQRTLDDVNKTSRRLAQPLKPTLDAMGSTYTARAAEQPKSTEGDGKTVAEGDIEDTDAVAEQDR
jgi:predicted transcriptional regulator of viral defense system